jgi:hypothetical protein
MKNRLANPRSGTESRPVLAKVESVDPLGVTASAVHVAVSATGAVTAVLNT